MPSTDANDWAYDEVTDRLADPDNGADAWALVTALVTEAEGDALGVVAAGPLEDFVRIQGNQWIEAIEVAARRDSKFQEALGWIWLGRGDLPTPILERVVAASGGRIKPLDT